MKTDLLLKDPVFQLNLLLWMAKEQATDNYYVYPLFHQLGFKIIYIENPFAFPPETTQAIQASGLDISIKPEPDLILGNESEHKALYFEAKANSFSSSNENCRQSRAHLLASGPAFRESFSPFLNNCLLCYVLPSASCQPMRDCLDTLTKELNSKALKPGAFSSHGLAFDGGQIIYSWDHAFKIHTGTGDDSKPVLKEIRQDTDPSPLILVFSDQDCHNPDMQDFYRRVMINQVRACLLSDLHAHNPGPAYETTPDTLLMKTTDQIFRFLGLERQKGLRRLIRENIFKRIYEYWKDKQAGIKWDYDRLIISWSVIGEKDHFLDWLEDRRTSFDTIRPPEEEPTLFDQVDLNPEA